MSPEQQIERSMLAGKDREELHTIAGAIGVKAATRMRKADLIEAILDAANGGDTAAPAAAAADGERRPTSAKPRRVRSARASQVGDDPIAALAAEENALGGDATAVDEPVMPRPRTAAPPPRPRRRPPHRPRPPTSRSPRNRPSGPPTTTDAPADARRLARRRRR